MQHTSSEVPSPALEEYLKTIYSLAHAEGGVVRPGAVAEVMDVAQPTVTVTLRRLKDRGWIVREGTGVLLTEEGRAQAVSVVRRNAVAVSFLESVLDLPREEAAREACVLEHALSPRTAEALERFLHESRDLPRAKDGGPRPVVAQQTTTREDAR